MKNTKLYIIILAVVILGSFLVYFFAFKDNTTKDQKVIEISINDLEAKINNKETFILVLSQTGCSHCNQYLPELERSLKEVNLYAYELNISKLGDVNSNTLAKYITYSGTPTTVFFINGAEKTTLNRIVGYAPKVKIIERLKSLGYVK